VSLDKLNIIVESLKVVGWEDSDSGCGGPGKGGVDTVGADGVLLLSDGRRD